MRAHDVVSLADAIAAQAMARPDLAIFTLLTAGSDGVALAFGDLHAGARRMAVALQSAGLRPGDTAMLVGEHDQNLLTAFVATLYVGATPMIAPYPTSFSQPMLYERRLRELAAASRAHAVLACSASLPGLVQPLVATGCRLLDTGALVSDAPAETTATHATLGADPLTPAYIQFSSGTTGAPKGASISQTALLRHLEMLTADLQLTPDDVLVGWAPFYHDLGLVFYLLLPLVHGIPAVTLAPDRWVRRPQLLLNALDAYGGTVCIMPNFGFAHTTRNVRERDIAHLSLRHVRHLIAGAEVVQPGTLDAFVARFERLGLRAEAMKVGYGMTECVFMASVSRSEPQPRVDRIARESIQTSRYAIPDAGADAMDVVSCGFPLPETQIEIVDDAGNTLGERQIGEVAISSPALFTSYVGCPDLTASALRNGRLFTGDLGYFADGELFVVDRKKDLIIAAGKHLYPDSLEQIALAVLGERGGRAAAFGLPSPVLGTEAPILVCELRGQADGDEIDHLVEAIRRQALQNADVTLADIRLVRRGWLEITTSGKVSRSATRTKYLAAGYRPLAPRLELQATDRTDPLQLEQVLATLATQVLGVASVQPQDNLFDVGADSLTAVRFILAVEEQFGVQVVNDFFHEPTVAHLVRLLRLQPDDALKPPSERKPPRVMGRRRRHAGWVYRGPMIWNHGLPYGIGLRLQRAWLALPGVRSRLLRADIELIERWGELAGVRDIKMVIEASLLANTWCNWRTSALTAPLGVSPWVRVLGDPALWQPAHVGPGVIFAPLHAPLVGLLLRGLKASGLSLMMIHGSIGIAETAIQDRALQFYQAHEALGSGTAVVLTGDGGQGTQGVVVPFFGGQRLFRQGGAELAVQTGARLIPVFSTINANGRVEFDFCTPLDRGTGSAQAQIERLTLAYAELVVARWPQVYHCLAWGNLARRLDMLERGQV